MIKPELPHLLVWEFFYLYILTVMMYNELLK